MANLGTKMFKTCVIIDAFTLILILATIWTGISTELETQKRCYTVLLELLGNELGTLLGYGFEIGFRRGLLVLEN